MIHSSALTWVTDLLTDLEAAQRSGLVMEVRLRKGEENGDRVVVSVIEQFSPAEYRQYRQQADFSSFFGKVEQHYRNGLAFVRVMRSFTEEEYRRLGRYTPVDFSHVSAIK